MSRTLHSALAGVPSGGRVRKADARAGKRVKRFLASTSVHACWLPRITTSALCRVTDVASKLLVVDAGATGYELKPLSRPQRPRPRPGMPASAEQGGATLTVARYINLKWALK